MLRIKIFEIFKIYLCLLLLIPCCSNNPEQKIYKTTTALEGLQMFTDVDSYQHDVILEIPFKSKVEIVDKKKYYIPDDQIVSSTYSKVKYKETIGYVHEDGLSEKDDIPFINDRKYNLPIDEFDYDRMSVIKALKRYMLNTNYYKDKISYYYIDNPQMFSLYGKNCDDTEIKVVAIMLNSKVDSGYSRMICFKVDNKKFAFYCDSPVEIEDKIVIEENIKDDIKNPNDCYP